MLESVAKTTVPPERFHGSSHERRGVGARGRILGVFGMAVNISRIRLITSPTLQREVRLRTATDLWRKIRELNQSDADRTKITAAYLQLGDVVELVAPQYRVALGGSILN